MRLSPRPVALWLSAASAFPSSTLGWVRPAGAASRAPFGNSRSALRMSSTTSEANKFLRVALCQFHVTPIKEENKDTAKSYLAKAKESGADLVVLPEVRTYRLTARQTWVAFIKQD
jgi:hypothetical protein